MRNTKAFVILLSIACLCIHLTNCLKDTENNKIVYARVKSCPGCSLNRLSEVKSFIYEDVPNYENVEFIKISGAKPELFFYNNADEEVGTIPLSSLSRKECNDLLISKGFTKKEAGKQEF